jgi:hypothetical protein
MIHRPVSVQAIAATAALAAVVAACSGAPTGPVLTDPTAIVTAALTSTEAAKTVHVELAASGTASVPLPIAGSSGTPIDLTGATASADVDLAKGDARVTFSLPGMLGLAGELIAVDGKLYIKTTLTGAQYQETDFGGAVASPSPSMVPGLIDNLGDMLLKQGVTLVKGDDVACGSKQCYTVSADLDASTVAPTATGSIAGLPIDLTGASVKLTLHVEKDLPNHLAGVTADVTTPSNGSAKLDLTFSKWDEPVSITAPPADQVKTAS